METGDMSYVVGVVRRCWVRKLVLWLMLSVSLALVESMAVCQVGPSGQQAQVIFGSLRIAVERNDIAQIQSLSKSLQGLGEAGVPAIEVEMKRGSAGMQRALANTLRGIPGERATSLLFDLMCKEAPDYLKWAREHDRTGRRYYGLLVVALSDLENRSVARRLSANDLRNLASLVGDGNPVLAGNAARVLGRCEKVSPAARLAPILVRLRREVSSPSRVIGSGYLSPEVFVRCQLLLAISYIGPPAVGALRRERALPDAGAELRKWLLLALGMAGDGSVQNDLKALVTSEPDRYVRVLAIHAYSGAAQRDSLPFLESLLGDTTVSEYGDVKGKNVFLIRNAASSDIHKWQSGPR